MGAPDAVSNENIDVGAGRVWRAVTSGAAEITVGVKRRAFHGRVIHVVTDR